MLHKNFYQINKILESDEDHLEVKLQDYHFYAPINQLVHGHYSSSHWSATVSTV